MNAEMVISFKHLGEQSLVWIILPYFNLVMISKIIKPSFTKAENNYGEILKNKIINGS